MVKKPRVAKPGKATPPSPKPLERAEQSLAVTSFVSPGQAATPPPRRRLSFVDLSAQGGDPEELSKRELGGLFAHRPTDRAFRLAFDSNPHRRGMTHGGLYRLKQVGIPDVLLKKIPTQDWLVGSIVLARQSQAEQMGVLRPDRFSKGLYFDWHDKRKYQHTEKQQREALQARVQASMELLLTCGRTDGWDPQMQMSLGQWLGEVVRSGVTVGRMASEAIWVCKSCGAFEECQCPNSEEVFHSFRPLDAGTIYPTIRDQAEGAAESVRERSQELLRRVHGNPKLKVKTDEWDRYAYVQVIDGQEVQVYTDEQVRVKVLYPIPDVEWEGFPCTPLDIVITEVMTHISIGRHNYLYFQNGRAARGMIIITSDEVDQDMLMQVRQQFMASINGVQNAHRMPTFGLAPGDSIQWVPMDNSSRDMEYQFLSDSNTRSILTAFQMSPEELPGCAHLSKGTASQSLAECLDPETRIWTAAGLQSIGSILGTEPCVTVRLWNGTSWLDGRAFWSGPKHLQQTELECGLVLRSSPDHRFMVVGPDGEPCWKVQGQIEAGDFVLVNKQPLPGGSVPLFRGKEVTEELLEILGWMTGDGTLVAPKKRSGGYIKLYYHHELERDEWAAHARTLEELGLHLKHREHSLTDAERERRREEGGFGSVAGSRIYNIVYSNELVKWLLDMGFTPSSRKAGSSKQVPAFVHALSERLRAAFLRGLFSADGGKLDEEGSVALTIQNPRLRDQVRLLMLGMGVRTLRCKGVFRRSFGRKYWSYKLFVKDRELFWNKIGFTQQRKQLHRSLADVRGGWNEHDLPAAVVKNLVRQILATVPRRGPHDPPGLLDKRERSNLHTILNPRIRRSCSSKWLFSLMDRVGVVRPQWLQDFHVERVIKTTDLAQVVPMVDIEVFSDDHGFIAEGIQVHNSSQEYLLEAHRDLGIRPLLAKCESYLNEFFKLIDPEMAALGRVRIGGLETQTKDQEDAAMERFLTIDGSLNEVLTIREKETLPPELGANVPLNQTWSAVLQSYVPVGTILEKLFDKQGAAADPRYAYVRDPFYWQNHDAALSQLSMVLQPPMTAIAPLVLPQLLLVAFPFISPQQAMQAAQLLVQGIQQQQEAEAQAAAQGVPLGDKEAAGQPAQKSEARARKLLGTQKRLVDGALEQMTRSLQAAARDVK